MKTLFESILTSYDDNCNIFVIVKPGFLDKTKNIINIFENAGWTLDKIRTKKLLLSEAKRLYDVHKKEDFYDDLCNYMSSDLSTGMVFVKNEKFTNKLFKEVNKIKDKVRKEYGESDMRNCLHSSDSLERMKIERGIYF